MKQVLESAQNLASLLYPLGEVAVYQKNEERPVKIFNRISQEELKTADIFRFKDPAFREFDNGRKAKTSLIPFSKDLFLLVSIDISALSQLATFTDLPKSQKEQEPGKVQIEHRIEDYLHRKQLTIGALNRQQKQELVLGLYQAGLFQYKDAAKFISDQLNLSRASVYNYLNWAKAIRKVRIHQVDTFTDQPFHGNPAGVVLDAEALDDDTMQKITREMNLSETAFVLPSNCADFRLRYFTPPGHEIKFCGHSTVGALYTIAHEKLYGISGPGDYQFSVETTAGVINMEIHLDADEKITLSYESPDIQLVRGRWSHDELKEALGTDDSPFNRNIPLGYDSSNKIAFAVFNSLDELMKLECEFKTLGRFCKQEDLIAVCLITTDSVDPANHVHIRVFCPAVGIPEDPFTGCLQGALAAYLDQHHLLQPGLQVIGVEQGHALQRPGTTQVSFACDKGKYTAKVRAQAVHFFATEINLV